MAVDIKFSSEESENKRAKVRGEGGNAPHTLTNSHTLPKPNQSLILNLSSNPSVIRPIPINTSSATNIIARAIFTTVTNRMYNSIAIILKVHSMNLL